MAKAELNFKTTTKQVTRQVVDTQEVKKVSGVTLTLTKREARTLHTVLRRIAGHREITLRGVTDNIMVSLVAAGVGYYDTFESLVGGSLCFTEASLTAELLSDTFPGPQEVHTGGAEVAAEEPAEAAPYVPQVGDKVRIVRKVASHTGGWMNSWVSRMDEYVNDGKVYTVYSIRPAGVYFEEDYERYGFPPAALEKVDRTLRVGARIRITETRWDNDLRKEGDTGVVTSVGWGGPGTCDVRIDRTGEETSVGRYSKFEVIG